jgi:DNA polymerase-2
VSNEVLGFLLQPTYRVRRGRPVIQLYGKLASGRAFLVEDDRHRPYFFATVGAERALREESAVRVEPSALHSLDGRPLVRVEAPIPAEVPRLRRKLEAGGFEALEADIRFAYRYLIDRGLRASFRIEGPAEPGDDEGIVRFHNPELSPARVHPELSLLSLDIETTPDASRVLSVALVGEQSGEVHMVSERAPEGAHGHPNEIALLRAVAARIRALDPDLLTGWNVVDFDLRVLERRARALGVPFEIGRVGGRMSLQRDQGFTRQSRADVPGRQVVDGPGLVRDAFITLDDYRLETAARELLGRGKRIAHGPDPAREIERMYREDPAAFVAYNREDAQLVLDILEREGLIDLAIERSLIAGMPLDRVGASIATFDRLYLPELWQRGFAAPSVDAERKSGRVTGGAVLDSHPGLYRNVAVYDFKSLYPSLMRTFNLDPLAHALADDDAIVAPNGARFSRGAAILPELLEDFFERRAAAKARGARHADLALKIMMNALYGVLGAGSCRFFDPEIANAISGFGQAVLGWMRDAFEAEGMRVLYGDTDSVFVALDPDASEPDARERGLTLRARVEAKIADRIRADYAVEPRLDLELERIYTRFFQPSVRAGKQGSKKRYAGLVAGELEVVGLEAVRRDWPAVAGRLQKGMLALLFADRPPEPFAREIVERVRSGELDRELVIRKGLRKGSVDRYTKTTPPHIQAARKAEGPVGRVVRYVIARSGPEPVLDDGPLPADLDYEYYVEHVLRPIADSLLEPIDSSFDRVLGRPSQLTLL